MTKPPKIRMVFGAIVEMIEPFLVSIDAVVGPDLDGHVVHAGIIRLGIDLDFHLAPLKKLLLCDPELLAQGILGPRLTTHSPDLHVVQSLEDGRKLCTNEARVLI